MELIRQSEVIASRLDSWQRYLLCSLRRAKPCVEADLSTLLHLELVELRGENSRGETIFRLTRLGREVLHEVDGLVLGALRRHNGRDSR